MNPDIQNILDELRKGLERLYEEKLHRILLFGSYARGESQEGSDIDVLIVLKNDFNPAEEISRTGEITASLSLKYNFVISCIFISKDRFENEGSPLLLNVRREGIAI
ncbi:MAG: nucleotidyltransferase domain-containing protein [Nitrosopumilaceae archaeon]|nr:nucleotidyltransferase domain-containing protein [Nitrosopumilaceae archaeon]NIV64739.1 nucleotidyltransferase domain-containing protein [Nitrosopumilaceae archaeon]NIX61301.1 nucleotidyltransferase domain-containing protein [Nitrosopumilaceae archaeon]